MADTLSRCSTARTAQVEGHLEDDDDYEAMCDITATVRASRHAAGPAATELATQLTTLPAAATAALVATAATAATTQFRHVRRVARAPPTRHTTCDARWRHRACAACPNPNPNPLARP